MKEAPAIYKRVRGEAASKLVISQSNGGIHKMKRKMLLVLSLILILSLGVFGGAAAQDRPIENIVDIAASNGSFDTLHAAIVAAGLADTLASADNEFTVFAPTDSAFAAVAEAFPGLLDALLADPTGDLTTILTYHVVPGRLSSADVLASSSLTTVQGEELTVSLRDGAAFVDNAQIVATDVQAKNGVIHVIDSVLVPSAVTLPAPAPAEDTTEAIADEPMMEEEAAMDEEADMAADEPAADSGELMTIAEIAVDAGFTELVDALTATGLVDIFAQPGNYTVFAPTNEAFEAIKGQFTADQVESILLYHVVNDALSRDQIATSDLIPTLSNGRPLFVTTDSNNNITDISGAQVVVFNIPASNGIIHVIDTVMVP